MPPVNPQMDVIDYFTNYVKFVVERESTTDPKLSEDVCACCKDGGSLIECDFKADSAPTKCLKVFHEGSGECLCIYA